MYHHMPIHYDTLQRIAMCRISVDIKAERRDRGQLHYVADASPHVLQPSRGEGGAQLILY